MSAPAFRRILLTGGNGFVGGYLAPAIVSALPGAERLLLRRPGEVEAREGWRVAEAEIFDREAISAIVERFKPDLVLHLAAQSSVGEAKDAAEATWRVNFDGSFALASACARVAPCATFFFVSSGEVYGLSFRNGPVREDSPLQPMNVYARSKAAAEQVIADVLPPDARLIVARSFNHTGPGQDERFVLPSFSAQIARIEAGLQPPEIKVGNLDAERDFLDVQDVCDAYIALIRAAPSLPTRNIFNVSSGSARSIRSLLDLLCSQSAVPIQICVDPDRLRQSDIPSAIGLNDALQTRVVWKPTRPIQETLAALLQHARDGCVRAGRAIG
jgi:GDP-4-dehydro-6-deoxy-D-mannose reductase